MLTQLIDTFINGNLSEAKMRAKNYGRKKLRDAFVEHAGFSFEKAQLAVDYLKDGGSFQDYCAAK